MTHLPLPPAYSQRDPATSALAAARMDRTGARRRQVDQVVALVKAHPGCTSAELARISGLDRPMIARRLPDAAQPDGKLTRGDGKDGRPSPRVCSVTGSLCCTWWAR